MEGFLMAWVRVDDSFYDHRKFAEAGPLGVAQYVAALAYCNRNLTDGFVPRSAARRLLDWEGITWNLVGNGLFANADEADGIDISEHLVACGLFEEAEGGFRIHDYHDYQPTAEEVNKDRDLLSSKRSEAGRKGAAQRWQNGKQIANEMANDRQDDSPNPNPISKLPPPTTSIEGDAERSGDKSEEVIAILVDRLQASKDDIGDVTAWRAWARRTRNEKYRDTISELIQQHTTWTAEQIANVIQPSATTTVPATKTASEQRDDNPCTAPKCVRGLVPCDIGDAMRKCDTCKGSGVAA